MPVRVAARITAPFGDIASRLTYHQLAFAVDGQLGPGRAAVGAREDAGAPDAVAVVEPFAGPAYIVLGSPGCITIVETARFAMKSSTGAHEAPPSVVLKIPPPTLPANITFGVVGSMTSDRTRPPMLPGPSHVQLAGLIPADSGRGSAGAGF